MSIQRKIPVSKRVLITSLCDLWISGTALNLRELCYIRLRIKGDLENINGGMLCIIDTVHCSSYQVRWVYEIISNFLSNPHNVWL